MPLTAQSGSPLRVQASRFHHLDPEQHLESDQKVSAVALNSVLNQNGT